eukprot:TRINITY_DN24324_c0_g1_i1.p1 TRINITY_DN24324_c0_g1~~TRINITY_DN24324_c0_g1_i1.p1  ORF type:complete len:287 (+),score=53.27 TRINITY_DN24324_c0_g1_i1:61-921(+)
MSTKVKRSSTVTTGNEVKRPKRGNTVGIDVIRRAFPDSKPPQPQKGWAETVMKKKRAAGKKGTLDKLSDKLKGGKFRWLNEKLYTTSSNEADGMFKEEPELFDEYHEGFRDQVAKWPSNPVDVIAKEILKIPTKKGQRFVVADLGCGDGLLACKLQKAEVHSFDLVSKAPHVTRCDIARAVPLPEQSCDVVVLSLALMGTNWPNIIREAHRILAFNGVLKIAEVTSRLQNIPAFLTFLSNLGFNNDKPNQSNTHFISITSTKVKGSKKQAVEGMSDLLQPCLYKKR